MNTMKSLFCLFFALSSSMALADKDILVPDGQGEITYKGETEYITKYRQITVPDDYQLKDDESIVLKNGTVLDKDSTVEEIEELKEKASKFFQQSKSDVSVKPFPAIAKLGRNGVKVNLLSIHIASTIAQADGKYSYRDKISLGSVHRTSSTVRDLLKNDVYNYSNDMTLPMHFRSSGIFTLCAETSVSDRGYSKRCTAVRIDS